MKISQLLNRENFYGILENTIAKNSFFLKSALDSQKIVFQSYKYLNIIFSIELSKKCRNSVVNEYTLSQSELKKLMQKIYVYLAFLPLSRNLFIHKKIKISNEYQKYAIVGGNHRVRLFEDDLSRIIVLLKDGENEKFISNDIECRIKNKVLYAPKILSFGKDWFIEEYVRGVPFNRIKDEELLKKAFEVLVIKHMKDLIFKTKSTVLVDTYLRNNLKEVYLLINQIKTNDSLKNKLISTVKSLHRKIKNEQVSLVVTSFTHGDFQKGNLRITPNNDTIVIDWEASDTRFYLYDLFVLLSGIREGKELKYGMSIFFEQLENYDNINRSYSKMAIMAFLCLEDLLFNLNEDISINYFCPGVKSGIIAESIDKLFMN